MNDWFTTPADDGNGHTIIVTGRLDVDKFGSRERNNIRIEVTMPYPVSYTHLTLPTSDLV